MNESHLPVPHPDTVPAELPAWLQAIQSRTPARILVGRSGPAYRTATQLQLRRDHAAALDAVQAELNLEADLGKELVQRWGLFEVRTQAQDKQNYLMRPDLGRRLAAASRDEIVRRCPAGADLQIVIGDGLSAAAVVAQVPTLLPLLDQQARQQGLCPGQPFVIRYCRVGVMNEVGELLHPQVIVLLIGERPGLATAISLSAYMAFRPQPGHNDSQRNLLSNIHAGGVPPEQAAGRILSLVEKMRQLGTSGVAIKEDLTAFLPLPPALPKDRS